MPHFDDGDFSVLTEVSGSGSIYTDPETRGITIGRRYIQNAADYVPDPVQIGVLTDATYTDAVLTSESATPLGDSGFLEIVRVFATIPETRTETEQVAFTRPGRSRVLNSAVTTEPIGWNKYGLATPSTRYVNATVTYSYSLSSTPPTTTTLITCSGEVVDFTGQVYKYVGPVVIDTDTGRTEERWEYEGITSPGSPPGTYIVSVSSRRYAGPIWEHRVVSVT